MAFCAGFNTAGYLPDNEPAYFETFDYAKRYLIDEMERAAEVADADEPGAWGNDISNAQQDVNLWNELDEQASWFILTNDPDSEHSLSTAWWIRSCMDAEWDENDPEGFADARADHDWVGRPIIVGDDGSVTYV